MQELSLFSDIMLLFQNGYNGNNKNITVVSQSQSFKLSLNFYVLIRSTDGNIRDCLLLNCAFIISDVRQSVVLQFVCKTSKKEHFRFSVVFSRTIVQISILILEDENLENGLVSFCRILNGYSDEVNLFWRCSSPLTPKALGGGGRGVFSTPLVKFLLNNF